MTADCLNVYLSLQAIMQIQQGMERLRTAAPEVFQSLGLPTLPPNLIPPNVGSPAPAQPSPAAPAGNEQVFNQFMSQMMGQMRAGNPDQPPEERFASQLDQLASMGFVDRQANIQGNINDRMPTSDGDNQCFIFSSDRHHGRRERSS